MRVRANFSKVARAAMVVVCLAAAASAQNITNAADNPLSVVLSFGTLTPGSGGVLDSQQVIFRIRCSNFAFDCGGGFNGYHVVASLASFTVIPAAPADGGAAITPADIGVGITNVDTIPAGPGAPLIIFPRVDTVTAGFNYNPSLVAVSNGLTPYTGKASGQATLADIPAAGVTILSGNRPIATSEVTTGGQARRNYLEITMTFALLRQYWTPATVNATINLQIIPGP